MNLNNRNQKNQLEFWMKQEDISRVFSSKYWNNEYKETEKEFDIRDGNIEKLFKFLDSSEYRQQFATLLLFASEMRLEIQGTGVDVAAGVCWTTSLLSKLTNVRRLYAVDISRHRLEKLAPLVFDVFEADSAKIVRALGSFYDIHLPEGSVNFCFLSQAYHHADNPHKLLGELRRVLWPGGIILLMGETPISFWAIGKRRLKNLLKMVLPRKLYYAPPIYKLFPTFQELFPPDLELGDHYYRLKDYFAFFQDNGFSLHIKSQKRYTVFIAVKKWSTAV